MISKDCSTPDNPLTPEAVNKAIEASFHKNPYFQNIYVKGAISQISYSQGKSGKHCYLTLKYENHSISANIWASKYSKITEKFSKDALKLESNVIVLGSLSNYVVSGKYHIAVDDIISIDGQSEYDIQLKLFEEELKNKKIIPVVPKKLPAFPAKIGVITAKGHAAIEDVRSSILRKYPFAEIIHYHTNVQGIHASSDIKKKIEEANLNKELDFIIVCRGGGSKDDLKAFNTEEVVYAIVNSKHLVVTGIGHEIDHSIADLVADYSYKTPTEAAAESVPDINIILSDIKAYKKQVLEKFKHKVLDLENSTNKLLKVLAEKNPKNQYNLIIAKTEEQLISVKNSLDKSLQQFLKNCTNSISEEYTRLLHQKNFSEKYLACVLEEKKSLNGKVLKFLYDKEVLFSSVSSKLTSNNPKKILEMGYASLLDKEKKTITTVNNVKVNDDIQIILKDGSLNALVKNIKKRGDKNGN